MTTSGRSLSSLPSLPGLLCGPRESAAPPLFLFSISGFLFGDDRSDGGKEFIQQKGGGARSAGRKENGVDRRTIQPPHTNAIEI